jgi:hypothetical protein
MSPSVLPMSMPVQAALAEDQKETTVLEYERKNTQCSPKYSIVWRGLMLKYSSIGRKQKQNVQQQGFPRGHPP